MIMERAFDLLERFVIAHEKLAAAVGSAPVTEDLINPALVESLADMPDMDSAPLKELVETRPQPPEPSKKDLAQQRKEEREELKAKLDDLGIDYTTKTSTVALRKKLEEAMAQQPDPGPEQSPTPVQEQIPLVEDPCPANSADMRAYLQDFITRYGAPVRSHIKHLLNDMGADTLSNLDPARYPELVRGVKTFIPVDA